VSPHLRPSVVTHLCPRDRKGKISPPSWCAHRSWVTTGSYRRGPSCGQVQVLTMELFKQSSMQHGLESLFSCAIALLMVISFWHVVYDLNFKARLQLAIQLSPMIAYSAQAHNVIGCVLLSLVATPTAGHSIHYNVWGELPDGRRDWGSSFVWTKFNVILRCR